MTGPGTAPPPPASAAPLPGWLGPVVTLTTQVGVPTVVAGVLLWFVLFRLDGTLLAMRTSGEEQVQVIAAMQETLIAALDKQAARFEQAIKDNIQANKDLAHEHRYYDAERYSSPADRGKRPGARAGSGDDAGRAGE